MGFGELSPLHLILVLVIALIVIGPGKLPDVGAALGKSIREFRKAASDVQGSLGPDVAAAPVVATPAAAVPVVAAASAPIAAEPASVIAETS